MLFWHDPAVEAADTVKGAIAPSNATKVSRKIRFIIRISWKNNETQFKLCTTSRSESEIDEIKVNALIR